LGEERVQMLPQDTIKILSSIMAELIAPQETRIQMLRLQLQQVKNGVKWVGSHLLGTLHLNLQEVASVKRACPISHGILF
jgi:hypothetical protein